MSALDGTSPTGQLEADGTGYGGRPYGLEPLLLPPAPVPYRVDGPLARRYADLLGTGPGPETGPAAGPGAPGGADCAERLFWFRWITGHQVTFLLWQELARRAAEAAEPTAPAPASADEVAAAARLVRGYSAMLLYTASCTRDVYHRVIRPSMALHHPAFSGAWARDYTPVRPLLRGRLPAAWAGRADALLGECALNETVHEGIAEKLVPGAPSLLQAAAGDGRALPRDVRAVLFDLYFLTVHAPCPPAEAAVQLLRRVRAVREDLAANGLYPAGASSRAERPAALRAEPVEEIEHTVSRLLGRLARDSVGCSGPGPPGTDPPTGPARDPSPPRPFEHPLEGSGCHGA
ncbi:L-tyrosine 3-hydroxylase [Streptomyces sp. LP11]|uniref:L-tyrosine 3-hydroxylase n=1 Tax=Streptomyces pyxinicus TaxID=2970331 RepID=A0ABT2BDY3_9ACTN|nr:L-tyrosine 3-hydroxylase [Streptomyces sp. LP11]MCS0606270.1 L-tyrosine 3-hydroxylase [Streptomyces sp. LP11]